ncbi:hypothetical protein QM012_009397 [Aureobasidium pullulans]|uniref:SAP domain-containing protein n=1 Tax=Aureobasidium pullulans TaxID=5580 RepID=A0ABR0THU0_AURPU
MVNTLPSDFGDLVRYMNSLSTEERKRVIKRYRPSTARTQHDPRNLIQRSIMARSIKQPVKSQAEIDEEKNLERYNEFIALLEKCCDEGICFCKHKLPENNGKRCRVLERILREAEEQPTLYSSWSVEDLRNEVKERNLALPKKRTKAGLTKILQQSDPPRPFCLMNLPTEVRLRIYAMAFDGARTGDLDVSRRADVAEPALLRTSRLVREEATPVFYGTAYFRFQFPFLIETSRCKEWFAGSQLHWLQHIKPKNLKHLRHVSFRLSNLFDEYDLQIDLASRSVDDWLIPSGSMRLECPCQRQKRWTLAEWRKKTSEVARPENQEEVDENFDKCNDIANKAIQEFHALCGQGDKVEPTIAGLAILAEAAHFILDSRDLWMFSCVDWDAYSRERDDD